MTLIGDHLQEYKHVLMYQSFIVVC